MSQIESFEREEVLGTESKLMMASTYNEMRLLFQHCGKSLPARSDSKHAIHGRYYISHFNEENDRVGVTKLRLLPLPHHRTYGFPYSAVESESC